MDGELRLFKEDIKDEVSSREWIDKAVTINEIDLSNEDLPIEIAVVRHGYWKDNHICSVCGNGPLAKVTFGEETVWELKKDYTYCPFCGAKMDGKK